MAKSELYKIEAINKPTKEVSIQKTKELSEYLSRVISALKINSSSK